MKVIDTHQHLWDLDLFSYSWCRGIPKLNRSFRLNDYLDAARQVDVVKSVHVEADVDEPFMLAETKHILSLAERENPLSGVVACARPERKDFRNYLDQIAAYPKLKGIRRVLHTQSEGQAELMKDPIFIENIKALEQYKLSFDLCVLARQLPQAINLIKQCPKVSFILDHCGNPLVKEKIAHPWQEHIEEMASLPNVVCKVSGLVTQANTENWTPEDLRPFVSHVIECFGWDRVMFGSDWPVCTLAASFDQWVSALMFLTRDADESNQQKLFAENAERVYRLI